MVELEVQKEKFNEIIAEMKAKHEKERTVQKQAFQELADSKKKMEEMLTKTIKGIQAQLAKKLADKKKPGDSGKGGESEAGDGH